MTTPTPPTVAEPPSGPQRRPGRHRAAKATAALAALAALAAAVFGAHLASAHPRASTPSSDATSSAVSPTVASSAVAADGTAAPNGTYTTPTGATATIASLHGQPTLVWFVAGGCASCAASIPAVAAHLGQITGHGVQVLTLGLYGAFPNGKPGVAQLLSFAKASADRTVAEPGWTWGMASESLSMAYDPSGTPDVYALIGPGGHIRYQNSVPDSTMPQLLDAVTALSTHPHTTSPATTGATDAQGGTTAATLP